MCLQTHTYTHMYFLSFPLASEAASAAYVVEIEINLIFICFLSNV